MMQNTAKIEKLIGMLASDFDGERAVAAKKIAEIAKSEKKTVTELLASIYTRTIYQDRVVYREAPPKAEPPKADGSTRLDYLVEMLEMDDRLLRFLTDWERNFIADLADRAPTFFSEKQAAVIERIIAKLEKGSRF